MIVSRMAVACVLLALLATAAHTQRVDEGLEPGEPEQPGAPPRLISVEPVRRTVPVGAFVRIVVEAANADRLLFDYGYGSTATDTFAYLSFGLKTIEVRALNDSGEAVSSTQLAVVGAFQPDIEELEVPHHAGWKPVTEGKVIAVGTYDEVRVFLGGELEFTVPRAERYEIPVPFVGTERLELVLYEGGVAVTRPVEVTMTGTNQPPTKPGFEGSNLLTVAVEEAVEFEVLCEDPNGDPLRFEARSLPEGAELDPTRGVFRWTPQSNQIGYHLINFYVYDVPYDTRNSFAQRTILVVG